MTDPLRVSLSERLLQRSRDITMHDSGCPAIADDESDYEHLADAGTCVCLPVLLREAAEALVVQPEQAHDDPICYPCYYGHHVQCLGGQCACIHPVQPEPQIAELTREVAKALGQLDACEQHLKIVQGQRDSEHGRANMLAEDYNRALVRLDDERRRAEEAEQRLTVLQDENKELRGEK